MKDWQVFVVLAVLSFIMITVTVFPNGTMVTRVANVVIEILERVWS